MSCSDLPSCNCWRITPRISSDLLDDEFATDSPWQMGHFSCEATSHACWSSERCGGVLNSTYNQAAPIKTTRASKRQRCGDTPRLLWMWRGFMAWPPRQLWQLPGLPPRVRSEKRKYAC